MEKKKKRVLFLCTHNSCRSQMAEGLLRHHGEKQFEVFSAGTSPSGFTPWPSKSWKKEGLISRASGRNPLMSFWVRASISSSQPAMRPGIDAQSFRVRGRGFTGALMIRQKRGVRERRSSKSSEGFGMNSKNSSAIISFPILGNRSYWKGMDILHVFG